jgi:hypothetical protein
MRKRISLGLFCFLLLGLILLTSQPRAQFVDISSSTARPDSTAFNTRVAGSWLTSGEYSVDLGCDGTIDVGPIYFNDAQTFGVNGSHMATNPANPNTNHGTWVKTGPFQVSGRDIGFGVTGPTPGGELASFAIISFVFDFDRNFENATSNFGAKVYLPTQDPLDPAEQPFVCTIGQHTSMRKVSAFE